jgi:hypothetical protein
MALLSPSTEPTIKPFIGSPMLVFEKDGALAFVDGGAAGPINEDVEQLLRLLVYILRDIHGPDHYCVIDSEKYKALLARAMNGDLSREASLNQPA